MIQGWMGSHSCLIDSVYLHRWRLLLLLYRSFDSVATNVSSFVSNEFEVVNGVHSKFVEHACADFVNDENFVPLLRVVRRWSFDRLFHPSRNGSVRWSIPRDSFQLAKPMHAERSRSGGQKHEQLTSRSFSSVLIFNDKFWNDFKSSSRFDSGNETVRERV